MFTQNVFLSMKNWGEVMFSSIEVLRVQIEEMLASVLFNCLLGSKRWLQDLQAGYYPDGREMN